MNRQIFGAALTIGVLTFFVKLVTIGKELVIARRFGTSDELDAFLIAFVVPTFAINVIVACFNTVLIPTFVRVQASEGNAAAQSLLSSILFSSLALLLSATLIMVFGSGQILSLVGANFNPNKLALTKKLFLLLLPIMFLSGVSTTWGAILNAGKKFALVAITPIITPIVLSIFVVFFAGSLGIFSVAIAALLGSFIETVILGCALKRRGFFILPKWCGLNPAVKEVFAQYVPVASGAVLMSGTMLINHSMAAMLGPGSVASLNYGTKIVGFFLSVGSLALGSAVLPYFSKMVSARDWVGTKHTLKTYVNLLFVITVPITVVLVICSEFIIRVMFERGSFSANDTTAVSSVAALFALQIPFFLAGQIGVRLLTAMGKGKSVLVICAVNLTVNLSANWIFMNSLGVAGIAVATSIVYAISFLQIFYVINTELKSRSSELAKV